MINSKVIIKTFLLLCVITGSFLWGVVVHRDQFFPYVLMKSVSWKLGLVDRINIESRSPQLRTLQSLPYVSGTHDVNVEAKDVVLHQREKAFPGYNFYNCSKRETAFLIDMDGNVVHEWSYPSGEWETVELLPNGEIIAVVTDKYLLRLDVNSKVIWSHRDRFHHDVWVHDNGDIYAIARTGEIVPRIHDSVRTMADRIVVLSEDGDKKDDISVLDLFFDSPYAFLLPRVNDRKFSADEMRSGELDVLHLNHIEVFDGSLAHKSPLFRKGNMLISMRSINTIAIVDGDTKQIIWVWGPTNVSFQHQPSLLPNGNILLFDNGTSESQILEFDPLTGHVAWRYSAGSDFFSETQGSVQRLPNGNTLITESNRGYVFEVTPEKEMVWRFANPDFKEGDIRMGIWRMTRFAPDELSFVP